MKRNVLSLLSLCLLCVMACSRLASEQQAGGSLFIIGGGFRPPEMIRVMLELSGLSEEDYIAVLPMSSSEPDTAFYYVKKQFIEQGIRDVHNLPFTIQDTNRIAWLDTLRNATLIYITGGDQRRFMDIVRDTPVEEAIWDAYREGAMIAGTSAGAAVMSSLMITGEQFRYPEYTGAFRTIEYENIETVEGLGLLQQTIIDQHFIYRMRMNRLISAVIEHPDLLGIGIDESTALYVKQGTARVQGIGQVIVLSVPEAAAKRSGDLMGQRNLRLDIYLPGEVLDQKVF